LQCDGRRETFATAELVWVRIDYNGRFLVSLTNIHFTPGIQGCLVTLLQIHNSEMNKFISLMGISHIAVNVTSFISQNYNNGKSFHDYVARIWSQMRSNKLLKPQADRANFYQMLGRKNTNIDGHTMVQCYKITMTNTSGMHLLNTISAFHHQKQRTYVYHHWVIYDMTISKSRGSTKLMYRNSPNWPNPFLRQTPGVVHTPPFITPFPYMPAMAPAPLVLIPASLNLDGPYAGPPINAPPPPFTVGPPPWASPP
jgi:hypothetical protein